MKILLVSLLGWGLSNAQDTAWKDYGSWLGMAQHLSTTTLENRLITIATGNLKPEGTFALNPGLLLGMVPIKLVKLSVRKI